VFNKAFCYQAHYMYTSRALFKGMYPFNIRASTEIRDGRSALLLQLLKVAGYDCGLSGNYFTTHGTGRTWLKRSMAIGF